MFSKTARNLRFVAATLAWLIVTGLSSDAQSTSAADGVYTAAQADRGKAIVEDYCSRCHGADLSGIEAPALVGPAFMLKWEPRTVDALFKKIRDTMPAGSVDEISEDDKIDAVAYILQQNGLPDGTVELTHDIDALARLRMSKQTGPPVLRTGSLVRATGCLSQGAGSAWMLTSATEPRATANVGGKPADEAPLGTLSLRLLNVFPDPSAHKGHKIQVDGLLVKDPNGDGVNVLSLEMLSATCDK